VDVAFQIDFKRVRAGCDIANRTLTSSIIQLAALELAEFLGDSNAVFGDKLSPYFSGCISGKVGD